MNTTDFPLFHETFSIDEPRVAFDEALHGKVAESFPAELVNEWRLFGFGGYGGGLIWTIPPDQPVLDPDDWHGLDESGIQVLRTAFASVCIWQGGQFLWLNVHTGKIAEFIGNPQILFDANLVHRDFRKDVLMELLFVKIRKRLGGLDADECYGFAPLPALGGTTSEKSAIKTQIRWYVAMAAQVLS